MISDLHEQDDGGKTLSVASHIHLHSDHDLWQLTLVTDCLFPPACTVRGGIMGNFGALSFTSLRETDTDSGALAAFPVFSLATIWQKKNIYK
jgi:hypothetical protein